MDDPPAGTVVLGDDPAVYVAGSWHPTAWVMGEHRVRRRPALEDLIDHDPPVPKATVHSRADFRHCVHPPDLGRVSSDHDNADVREVRHGGSPLLAIRDVCVGTRPEFLKHIGERSHARRGWHPTS
jgi:hypothetical protein